jgi:predicted O-methyltransferase YrrM
MDQTVEAVLAEYDSRAKAEEKLMRETPRAQAMNRRDEWLLAVGPATGSLLNLLAREASSRAIVEIGTSYGYSTVWLAEAARANAGKVVTLEIHAGKAQYAREQLAKAGLTAYVDIQVGDAQATLAALSGPFDFVLLDLWKDLYVPCFDLFYPKLASGALIVADNMLYPETYRADALKYRQHVRAARGMSSVLLPVGSGIEVSRFDADPQAAE